MYSSLLGECKNGTGAVGCGPQEEFRACSDVAITNPDGSADDTPNTLVDPVVYVPKKTAALSYDDSDRRFGYSIIEVVPLQDETEPEQVYHHNFSEPITDPNNIKRLPNVSNEDAKQQTPEIFQLNDNEPQSKEPRTPNSKTRCKCKSVIYILVSYSLHYDFNTI